jgi:hypothetical protein
MAWQEDFTKRSYPRYSAKCRMLPTRGALTRLGVRWQMR